MGFVNNNSLTYIDNLGEKVVVEDIEGFSGKRLYVVNVDGVRIGYIVSGKYYIVPSTYNDTGCMAVEDYKVKLFKKDQYRMLSDIIINHASTTEIRERAKQGTALVLSLGYPLSLLRVPREIAEQWEKITKTWKTLDTIGTTFSVIYSDKWTEALKESIGFIPIVSTGKVAIESIVYDSGSLKPFDNLSYMLTIPEFSVYNVRPDQKVERVPGYIRRSRKEISEAISIYEIFSWR